MITSLIDSIDRLIIPTCDLEVQSLFKINKKYLESQLKIAHLISSKVVISPSFIFESKITQNYYVKNKELISSENVITSMKEDDILDFIENKQGVYFDLRDKYPGYYDIKKSLKVFDGCFFIKRNEQMIEQIKTIWEIQLCSDHPFSLKSEIMSSLHLNFSLDLIEKLKTVPKMLNDLPFTWEVLEFLVDKVLLNYNLDLLIVNKIKKSLRLRLLAFYFQSLSLLSKAHIVSFGDLNCEKLDQNFCIGAESCRVISINLFKKVLKILGVKEYIENLTNRQIIELKNEADFQLFMLSYYHLLNECNTTDIFIQNFPREIRTQEEVLSKNIINLITKAKRNGLKNLIISIDEALSHDKGFTPKSIYRLPEIIKILNKIPLVKFRDCIIEQYSIKQIMQENALNISIQRELSKNTRNVRPFKYIRNSPRPKRIFISYCHKDKAIMKQFSDHLEVFKNLGYIDLFIDTSCRIGEKWKEKINSYINSCNIAILLVSNSYLLSNYSQKTEIPFLIQRYEKKELIIFPIIIKSCNWDILNFVEEIKVLPDNGKTLLSFKGEKREEVIAKICREIVNYEIVFD